MQVMNNLIAMNVSDKDLVAVSVPFKPKYTVCWARMAGFPFWPARLCSNVEIESLQSLKSSKLVQVAVSFLGIRCEKGWVANNSICDFTPESLKDKFSAKKLKSDRDYRAAIVESVRVVTSFDISFPEELLSLVASYQIVRIVS
jgi:hypothetical protein